MTNARLLLFLAGVTLLSAEDGLIEGLVHGSDGRPLPSVEISLIGSESASRPRTTRSGSDGRFAFRDLLYGEYTLSLTKAGYEAGQRVSASATLSDADPTAFEGVDESYRRKMLLETPAAFYGLDLDADITETPAA